jgi:hypothetical protein
MEHLKSPSDLILAEKLSSSEYSGRFLVHIHGEPYFLKVVSDYTNRSKAHSHSSSIADEDRDSPGSTRIVR